LHDTVDHATTAELTPQHRANGGADASFEKRKPR